MAKRRAAAPAPKLAEKDMAKHVVKYLDDLGYTTYKEVAIAGGGSDRADIYAVSARLAVSVETKTSFSIKVIEQAWAWVGRAHLAFIAVPASKTKAERLFACDICAMLGIGVLEVSAQGAVRVALNARLHPTPRLPKLYDEQRDSVAGNADNDYVTPYKLTAVQVKQFMAGRKSATIREVVLNIKHHYANPASARASLAKLIGMGVIEGLGMHGNTVVHAAP
jgi:hypothetical protein